MLVPRVAGGTHAQLETAPPTLFDPIAEAVRQELVERHFPAFFKGLATQLSPLAMAHRELETMRAIAVANPEVVVVLVQLLSVYYRHATAAPTDDGSTAAAGAAAGTLLATVRSGVRGRAGRRGGLG